MKTNNWKQRLSICFTIAMMFFAFPITTQATEPQPLTVTPMIAAGRAHTVALRSDGTVWTWGNNENGQLGTGNNTKSNTPVQIKELSDIVAVDAGGGNTIALKKDGTVWTWGNNYSGQLGIDSLIPENSSIPVHVKTLNNITAIAAGDFHMIALDQDGNVYTWGDNTYGKLGIGSEETIVPKPTQVNGLNTVKAIDAGASHTVILSINGDVYAWGHNGYGQLGVGGATNSSRIPMKVEGFINTTSISAGAYNTLTTDINGDVFLSGLKSGNALDRDDIVTRPTKIDGLNMITKTASYTHSLALKNDGTLYAWGKNDSGQVGNGEISDYVLTPIKVNSLSNVTSIAAGSSYSVATNKDGYVYAWGYNYSGQLGDGTSTNKSEPVQVVGENGVGFFNLNAPEKKQTIISATASIPSPSYTVKIPEKIEVGTIEQKQASDADKIKSTEFTVTADQLENLSGAKVKVAISTTDGTFALANGSDTLAYEVHNAESGTALANNATFTEFTTNGSKTGYIKIDQSDIIKTGTYSAILDFTISLSK